MIIRRFGFKLANWQVHANPYFELMDTAQMRSRRIMAYYDKFFEVKIKSSR
jgi:hypothetical protein